MNSLKLAIPAAILSSLLGSMNGYVLRQVEVPLRRHAVHPDPVRHVHPLPGDPDPIDPVMSNIGLYGSLQGLILVHIIYGIRSQP